MSYHPSSKAQIVLCFTTSKSSVAKKRLGLGSHADSQSLGQTIGGGQTNVVFTREEPGDNDLRDAGFFADLIDGFGAGFDGREELHGSSAGFRFRWLSRWKFLHDFLRQVSIASCFGG